MTSQLRKSLGLVILGGLLFLLGRAMVANDAAIGGVLAGVGLLVAVAAAIAAGINLLRG